ncbi:MAG TPA: NINE protein [Phycisphaerales bacterium]|nr:NINE protein [Phycisphaerales bacterium]
MGVFYCVKCGSAIGDHVGAPGSSVHCPRCGAAVTVPEAFQPAPPPAPVAKPTTPRCSRAVYVICAAILGGWGIHNIVAGQFGRGLVKLLVTTGGMLSALTVDDQYAVGVRASTLDVTSFGFTPALLFPMAMYLWAVAEIVVVRNDGDGVPMP